MSDDVSLWARFKCWALGCDPRWRRRPREVIDAELRAYEDLQRARGYIGKGKPPALPPMPQVSELRCVRCGARP